MEQNGRDHGDNRGARNAADVMTEVVVSGAGIEPTTRRSRERLMAVRLHQSRILAEEIAQVA
jgi:hypothetical protein